MNGKEFASIILFSSLYNKALLEDRNTQNTKSNQIPVSLNEATFCIRAGFYSSLAMLPYFVPFFLVCKQKSELDDNFNSSHGFVASPNKEFVISPKEGPINEQTLST